MLIGILAGALLPVQTCVNGRLGSRLGTPFGASLISFAVALALLLAASLVVGNDLSAPLGLFGNAPAWIWVGGICGGIVLTGNILMLSRIGAAQTAILPILGQVLAGMLIDTLGLFGAMQVPVTATRTVGLALALVGAVTVALSRNSTPDQKTMDQSQGYWGWRLFAVAAGALTAVQAAANSRLGALSGSPLTASVVSFTVGIAFLLAVCTIAFAFAKTTGNTGISFERPKWWMLTGGIMGALYLLTSVVLASNIGVGAALVALLAGTTIGGLAVDHFGLLGCKRSPLTLTKSVAAAALICGAVLLKMF